MYRTGLNRLLTVLDGQITEVDDAMSLKIVEKINETMTLMDDIIEEELLELDLTDKRD